MRKYTNGVIKVCSEELKRRIVSEIESGEIGQNEASRLYGLNRNLIQKWLKQYGKLSHSRQIVEVVMKDEREKIEQLQQALADAHLKLKLYDKMFELAGDEYQTDIKKNFSTTASDLLRKPEKKSKGSAQ